MILLKNNKLVYIDTSEDDKSHIIATKSLEELSKSFYKEYLDKDIEYTLGTPIFPDVARSYIFKMTKSPYKDGSGIGTSFNGTYATKGEAINDILKAGFKVYKDGVEILLLED